MYLNSKSKRWILRFILTMVSGYCAVSAIWPAIVAYNDIPPHVAFGVGLFLLPLVTLACWPLGRYLWAKQTSR